MSVWERLPRLGMGLGFREPFRADVFRRRESIDFLEITTDHYLEASPEKRAELELLLDHFTLVPHGLDLSLGSAEGLDFAYLDQVAELIEAGRPAMVERACRFHASRRLRPGPPGAGPVQR